MATREEPTLDQEVFDKTLAAELAKGADRRVAEGRAHAAGIRAYRKVHGEPEREAPAAAAAVGGAVAYAPPPAAAVRTAPSPTGRVPSTKPSAPEKHRLLALVAPEG